MKDLGALTHILGVEVKRDRQQGVLTLHQGGFIKQFLERFGMAVFSRSALAKKVGAAVPTSITVPPDL